VRSNASEALGRLGDRRAVEPLIAALAGLSAARLDMGNKALRALGQIRDGRAVAPLQAAL
jgi:HEAT repeat protein